LGSVPDLPQSSDSSETFEFASRCLKECASNPRHQLCQPQRRAARPTRLLQIYEPGEPIKLQEKSSFSSFVDYIALSHCWGKDLPITTTTKTKNQRTRAIEWNELPPLFQDTVIIAHRLGIKYIWIDALCILQDDKSDWEQEASKMASVYANAYVTVAAVQAIDSNQRCLGPRQKPVKLIYKNTKGDTFVVKVRQVSDHHPLLSDGRPAEMEGPLVERAWALQEHVLCSRVLHYTSSELVFECRNMYNCECTSRFRQTSITTPALLPNTFGSKSRQVQFTAWHRLVEKYTLRKLTRASDKLPAISGMALKIQDMVESEYLAGLWQSNLVEDLLWSSAPDLQDPDLASPLSDYRAPTWSWASVDTQIRYEDQDIRHADTHQYLASITNAECEVASASYPLGEVLSGSINVHGPMLPGTLIAPETLEFYYKLRIGGPPAVDVFPDTLLVTEQLPDAKSQVRRARTGENYAPFKAPVICVGIRDNPSEGIVTGLVISRVNLDREAFERVGTFSCGREIFGSAQKRDVLII
jgi:Heterokaryon incompatibility protein (HET)